MVKVAVFCPRLPEESESARQARLQLCRVYLDQLSNVDAVEFETMEQLRAHYPRQAFRRILVARQSCYSQEFWQWKFMQKADVLDVLDQANNPRVAALQAHAQERTAREAKMQSRFA